MGVLYSIVILLYAFVAIRLIGPNQKEYDEYESNYTDLKHACQQLFIVLTLGNYPQAVKDVIDDTSYGLLIYFIPYILLVLLILVPIPVAVVFESYRENRARIIWKERFRERDSLLAAFYAVDVNKLGYIDQECVLNVLRLVFKRIDKETAELLINSLAGEDQVINVFEFFEIMDTILIAPQCFCKAPVYRCVIWDKFRMISNRIFKFDKIATNIKFDIFILLVVFMSCVDIILQETEQGNQKIIKEVEEVVKYIFVAEALIKILGLGIVNYFRDN